MGESFRIDWVNGEVRGVCALCGIGVKMWSSSSESFRFLIGVEFIQFVNGGKGD